MPEAMLAALDNGKQTYEVKTTAMPARYPGSALVKVRQTGVCGSDLHMTRDRNQAQEVASGHEIAGEVVELPRGETRLHVGDRVAIEMIGHGRACGLCYFCRIGQFRHCVDRAPDTGGGFAEYMTRRPGGMYLLPDKLDWTDGALVEPLAVSVHALRWGGMKPGDTVAVVGSHTIGLAAIGAAKASGARKVLASARYPMQADLARKMGADVVTGSEKGELEDAVKSATSGLGADMVVETVGGRTIDTLVQSVAACRSQGKVVVVGVFRLPLAYDFMAPILTEISMLFSSCYGVIDGRHDYEVAIDLMANDRIPFKQIVTHKFPLQKTQEAFRVAFDKTTRAVKVHITQ